MLKCASAPLHKLTPHNSVSRYQRNVSTHLIFRLVWTAGDRKDTRSDDKLLQLGAVKDQTCRRSVLSEAASRAADRHMW